MSISIILLMMTCYHCMHTVARGKTEHKSRKDDWSDFHLTYQLDLMLATGMYDCCVETTICRCGIMLPLTSSAVHNSSIIAITKYSEVLVVL